LEALGLAPCFDAVVFSDSYGRDHWKPSTRAFLAVAEELNLEPHRAVYVADNPLKDFLGARRAGMGTVRLTHADGEYVRCVPPTAEHAPDLTVDTIAKLGAVLIGDLGRGESRSSCDRMVSD
jgi:putative hydrolase of the HAD superfamily